jgi:flagellar biosynthesis/type III secretory pathway chaperone
MHIDPCPDAGRPDDERAVKHWLTEQQHPLIATLAKLQDRFKTQIDMAPADIREVATQRVLAKTPTVELELEPLYGQSSAVLATLTRLEHTQLRSEVSRDESA